MLLELCILLRLYYYNITNPRFEMFGESTTPSRLFLHQNDTPFGSIRGESGHGTLLGLSR